MSLDTIYIFTLWIQGESVRGIIFHPTAQQLGVGSTIFEPASVHLTRACALCTHLNVMYLVYVAC